MRSWELIKSSVFRQNSVPSVFLVLSQGKKDSHLITMNWKTIKENQNLIYSWDEFDGSGSQLVQVAGIFKDHAIAKYEDITYWIDETTQDMFEAYDVLFILTINTLSDRPIFYYFNNFNQAFNKFDKVAKNKRFKGLELVIQTNEFKEVLFSV